MENKRTVIVSLFRSYGIKDGRGFQPVYIYNSLKSAGLLERMYVLRIRDKNIDTEYVKPLPFLLLGFSYVYFKIFRHFLVNKRLYYFFAEIYCKYIGFKLRNVKNKHIIINHHLSPKDFERIKSNNNIITRYVGQYETRAWLDVIETEYKLRKIPIDSMLKDSFEKDIEIGKYFDNIICMSEYSRKTWKSRFPKKGVYVCPLGLDLKYINKNFSKSKNNVKEIVFIFVGRITVLKGVAYLIEAWKKLNLKNAKLQFYGSIDYNEKEYLDKLCKNAKNIEFMGYTPMDKIYEKGLVLVHPTITGGFEKVSYEAMSAGLAVITTPIASEFHKSGKSGFIIPTHNTNEIAKYIKYFYDNPNIAIKMGKIGKKLVSNKSWDLFGKTFLECIKKIEKN